MKGCRNIREAKRSQRGASMPLALLLFLICAMTAAIVLAASTVVAGRAADLPQTEQAYYSTTSAVNLFRDKLLGDDGKGHTVTVAVKASGLSTTPSYDLIVTTDGVAAGETYSLLERAAMYLVFGKSSNITASDIGTWGSWPDLTAITAKEVATFNLKHASDKSDLDLQVEANLDSEGDLIFTFAKESDSSSSDYLSIFNLTCTADVETGLISTADTEADTEIKYVSVTWMPSVVEKG